MSAEELNRLGRHLRDVTDRIEIQTNPGPANASRDMNYDEKRKLSIFMGELDGDKLEKVIEIISQDQEDGLPGEPSHSSLASSSNMPSSRGLAKGVSALIMFVETYAYS